MTRAKSFSSLVPWCMFIEQSCPQFAIGFCSMFIDRDKIWSSHADKFTKLIYIEGSLIFFYHYMETKIDFSNGDDGHV